ncbi:unnamed protein product [Rotaria magnacalcarata]|uniref:Uncharacterized protein n=2 Tax=Rotaria magnacalcarata TaxID=392030 RepID=A0A8S2X5U7_9BILA|nr:unnamed protein product [Rotaria magnacalcarata]
MCCDFRSPINCYDDRTRYKTMIAFYIIDVIFFIIRLALVSNDISKGVSDTMSFLIPILLFDLIGSLPIITCNIIYIVIRHCVQPLIHQQSSLQGLRRFATMTCIRLKCHNERPQAVLLMRLIFIVCFFMLRFICFTIGASCSARFKSQCTAYTVIAAFALVASVLVIITEFLHFFRLWTYNPTETRNTSNSNAVGSANGVGRIEKTYRGHLGFMYHSLLNDQNAEGFRDSRCGRGSDCKSSSLHHYLFYHTLEAEHDIDVVKLPDEEKKSFVAFYITTTEEALFIAQNGFPYGDNTNTHFKEYLRLKQSIFFTRSCRRTDGTPAQAIICARINLGRIIMVASDINLKLNDYFAYNDGRCDTVYVKNTRRFYLRMPAQGNYVKSTSTSK